MTEMAKKSEESFRRKVLNNKLKYQKEDVNCLKERVAENFRYINLNKELTEILKIEQEQKIEEIKRNLDTMEFLKLELKKFLIFEITLSFFLSPYLFNFLHSSYEFVSNLEFESNSFGLLKLNGEENQDLISCSSDGTIKAWDLKGVKEMQKFKGHKSEVYCIESFKNNRLLSGSNDTTIKVWNIKTGEC
jgi:WD40 repeat protein